MKRLIILAVILFIPFFHAVSFSDDIYVPDHYMTIQEAIDAAEGGDTVIVMPDTYVENIDFKGKAITVKSFAGSSVTVIDGGAVDSVVTFQNGENLDSELRGFTITNGNALSGGGIDCKGSSPKILDNIIDQNYAYGGGGICCRSSSSPTIRNNTISTNGALYSGGGISCSVNSSPIIKNNTIHGNGTAEGGGIFCFDSSPTITNNTVYGNGTDDYGGGIYCEDSNPTIKKNKIYENNAYYGGGIFCLNSSPAIEDNNSIYDNYAYKFGGGIYCHESSPTIKDNNIYKNEVWSGCGGGIYCYESSSTITGNSIRHNISDNGGGLYCSSSSPTVEDNTFFMNTAQEEGGGIYCGYYSSPAITDNNIVRNSAEHGGGIYCNKSSSTITNNTIHKNVATWDGGGLHCIDDTTIITNNTVYGNSANCGGGIFCHSSSSTITNNIFWNDNAPIDTEICFAYCAPSITYCCVEGGYAGTSNIDADPYFVDAADGDFHIFYISDCVHSGDNTAPGLPDYDFDDNPRILGGTVDIGADEVHLFIYYMGDATPGGTIFIKLVGEPGTSPVGLFLSSGILNPPKWTMFGWCHLQYPLIGPINLGSIPSQSGVLIFQASLPQSPQAPYDIPMQALIGKELTNLCVLEVR